MTVSTQETPQVYYLPSLVRLGDETDDASYGVYMYVYNIWTLDVLARNRWRQYRSSCFGFRWFGIRQLIKTSELGLLLKPPPVLAPAVRPAYLEVLAIGVRGMQPFHMLPIQMPYMEIEVSTGVVVDVVIGVFGSSQAFANRNRGDWV